MIKPNITNEVETIRAEVYFLSSYSEKIAQSTGGKSPLAAMIAIVELCTPAPKLITVNVLFLLLSKRL